MKILVENKIKEYLKREKIVKPVDIEEHFNLTKSTTRRYLIKLEHEGFIIRNFGEIIYNEVKIHSEKIAFEEINVNKNVKLSIASTAAILAKDYTHVYIDGGSSCYYLIDKLNRSTHIYTNSIFNAMHALEIGFTDVYIIGGKVKNRTLSSINPDLRHLENLRFQIAFLGTNGIDDEGNLSTPDINEGIMKNFIATHSDLVVVLAEKHKFGQKAFYNFTPKNKNILVVTNYNTKKEFPNLFLIKNKE
ncbi:DeoR/GlpR family DNA-binding transcription regulator [Candidatus Mycoplasma pogonae]